MELNVVNALMGQGKTSAAINYINNAAEDEHFIFVLRICQKLIE